VGIKRAFLALSLSLKHDAHPALGSCHMVVRSEIEKQVLDLPYVTISQWKRMVLGKIEFDLKCKGREAKKRGTFLQKEKAAEEWGNRQVCGTKKALQIRRECECFGVALWQAGVDVRKPDIHFEDETLSFEGLLTNSTTAARADETDAELMDDYGASDTEFQFEDLYCISAKAQRHAAHGAPRREWTEKAWVAGSKITVTAPAHPRQQKQVNMKDARQRVAECRQVRKLRMSKRKCSPCY